MRDLNKIHTAPLFQRISPTVLETYLADCGRHLFKKKEMTFHPRGNSDYIYLLISGRIRLYLSYPNGKEFTLTILECGDVYSGHTRAFGLALEDSEVALIPAKIFSAMLTEIPYFSLSVIAVLGDALKNSIDIIENLAFRDVNERLVAYLINTAKERGVKSDQGLQVDFGLTHEEIATMMGSTRQTVSLFFNNLQKEGLLTVGKGRVTIYDLKSIEKLYYAMLHQNSE